MGAGKNFLRKSIIDYDGSEYKISFTNVKDMFSFNDQPPIVCLSTTKGGKTVLSIDLLFQYAKDARYVYYVSETEINEFGETACIPTLVYRNPREDCCGVLNKIWNDIKARGTTLTSNDNIYRSVFEVIYPGVDVIKLVNEYIKTQDLSGFDKNISKLEILNRIIIDRINSDPTYLEKLAETGNGQDLIDFVNSRVTKSNKTLLILDDMTSAIEKAKDDKKTIRVGRQLLKASDAIKSIFNDMFTRARHYNCLIFIFVHNIDSMLEYMRNITCYMFLNSSGFESMLTRQKFNKKQVFRHRVNELKIFDYDYHVFYCNTDSGETKITKADLHDPSEKVELHPDLLKFQRLLEKVQSLGNENLTDILLTPEYNINSPTLTVEEDKSEELFDDQDIILEDLN